MNYDEEIVSLLREIVENQRKAQAARKRNFQFANWIGLAVFVLIAVFMYWSTRPIK